MPGFDTDFGEERSSAGIGGAVLSLRIYDQVKEGDGEDWCHETASISPDAVVAY